MPRCQGLSEREMSMMEAGGIECAGGAQAPWAQLYPPLAGRA
jgi:hypothetical protein